ncbi:MAG: histidine--tRNA ligase [Pseudomonadota bacterium]
MSKKPKTYRPKARNPKGFVDRYGKDVLQEREMLSSICKVYEQFGFDPLETPAFEYTDALGKFLPDVDRPNAGVFSLQDDDDEWLSLRYDLTAPLARYVAANYDRLPKPFRRYAVGPVWRNEKPGPGRFRQFTQCDADTVGAPAPHADVECVIMLSQALEAVGLDTSNVLIRINDRNVLTGLLETIDIDEARDAALKLGVLRAMDKLDRLGNEGVRLLLGPGRKDESGDFTEGAGLSDDKIERVMQFMEATAPTNSETCDRLSNLIGNSAAGAKGVENLAAMTRSLDQQGADETKAKIDLSVIRGLEYYTGPVFEAELLKDIEDEKGRVVRFGSVASGGRYDGLVKRFKGVEVPAVGVSVGVSRLLAALSLENKLVQQTEGPVVIIALEADEMPSYQAMAVELREAGLRAEVYLGGSGMRAQLKYADKRSAPVAVIQGEDERSAGEVTVKDLRLGAELSKTIEDNSEWRAGQPAQLTVPRTELVKTVRAALDRSKTSA